jgi:hypothetical protein
MGREKSVRLECRFNFRAVNSGEGGRGKIQAVMYFQRLWLRVWHASRFANTFFLRKQRETRAVYGLKW